MPVEPRIFLDTSALFAAVWSAEGGARLILELGELGAVVLIVSRQVLAEAERALRRKAPEMLSPLTLLLHRANIQVASDPGDAALERCMALINYAPDARVLAAAVEVEAGYFVTLDKEHFLSNSELAAGLGFPVGTPGDCLSWIRSRFEGVDG